MVASSPWLLASAIGLAGLLAACDRDERAPSQPAATQRPEALSSLASVPTCTGETRLTPGIPGSPGHLVADERNPNGASELALLMRALRNDLAAARAEVLAGKPARIPASQHRIRCAWPTMPADRDARFDAMAVSYLRAVDAFNQHADRATYGAVIGACVRCHEGSCTGALAAIRPLELPKPQQRSPSP
jgi:hypothetical protein